MVKIKNIAILCVTLWSFSTTAQRLNVGISGGWSLNQNVRTTFEEQPYQFLYAAPYYSEPVDDFDFFGPPYDQVRIAQVYGITQDNSGSFRLGGTVSYLLKNDFRFTADIQIYQMRQRIYYGFQNLVLDIGDEQSSVTTDSPELLDDYIRLNKWQNSITARVTYDIPLKSISKPFVSFGYTNKYQFAANYSSQLIEEESSILADEDNIPEYYNSRVFQDVLYTEFSNEGFNHYITAGVGYRRFGFNASINLFKSLGNSKYAQYFTNHHFFTIDLAYDILSVPLFK